MGRADVVEAVARHSARAAARVHLKMKRGLDSVATIAATAPFVGLFGTVVGIVNSFDIADSSRRPLSAIIAEGIASSLVTTALGLLVAISASWFYTYLSTKLEAIDLEMQNASLQLVNQLILYRPR